MEASQRHIVYGSGRIYASRIIVAPHEIDAFDPRVLSAVNHDSGMVP